MVDIVVIFGIGGLILIAVGLIGTIQSEKLNVPSLPRWSRVSALIIGAVLLILSIVMSPQSPFSPNNTTNIQTTQRAIEATQTALDVQSQTPVVQTVVVTQPPITVTQIATLEVTSSIATDDLVDDGAIAIESLGVSVFDFSGRESGDGDSTSSLTSKTYRDIPYTFYDLTYTLTEDDSEVGLVLALREELDFSQFSALQFTIEYLDVKTRCEFRIWGAEGDSQDFVLGDGLTYDDRIVHSVKSTSRGQEETFTIPLAILDSIDLTAVDTMQFGSSTTLTGQARTDGFILSGVKLIK